MYSNKSCMITCHKKLEGQKYEVPKQILEMSTCSHISHITIIQISTLQTMLKSVQKQFPAPVQMKMYALKAIGNIFLLIGKSHPIWYCGQCRNLIDDDMEESIVCDSCLTWFHFHQISLKGPLKSKLWYCQTCYIITDKL